MTANHFSNSSFSSSSSSSGTYDVFLSYRGEDTRKNFTDHLYAALRREGIHTFRDGKELRRGQHICSELIRAIKGSKIAVMVFSKGYASSTWCLEELENIMECRKTTGQIVLPIFYNVDASDVRKQTGIFEEAFRRHELRFKDEAAAGRIKKWRQALTEAASLSGWDLQNVANGHEAKFIQKIVKDVLAKLDSQYMNIPEHLVGVDTQVKDTANFLRTNSEDVLIVGIYGFGGIGKTTMAKIVFNQLRNGFEGHCFLFDVKDESKRHNGFTKLQEQLLRDVLKSNVSKIPNVDEGINLIKRRICQKRILVVLDDVDQLEQWKILVGKPIWFDSGSRIIVTTRDEHLLNQIGVDRKYEAKELNKSHSLQLFSWHAFGKSNPGKDYLHLSNDVVDHIGGVPLALEVLGSDLLGRSILEWQSAIEELKEIPNRKIQQILRRSYDSLRSDKVKSIFLDITCFFIGEDKHYVTTILDACRFYAESGINLLIQRSLIKITWNNRIWMHNLIRDMGREIVREMSPDHPGKRSRIWFHDDALSVLKHGKGTDLVQGLALDVGASKDVYDLPAKSFASMTHLRLLQINGVHLNGKYEHLPKDLRWLCWQKSPFKDITLDFQLEDLVVLDMQYSNIRKAKIKFLNKLKILNFSHCVHLGKMPEFSGLPSLERLLLDGCNSLVEVHQSIGCLERLVFLSLKGCNTLCSLPESICRLKSLQTLNISSCSKLEKLPMYIGDMEALTELLADETAIKELPSSIGLLKNLRNLSFSGLKQIIQSTSWFSLVSSWLPPKLINSRANYFLPDSFAGLTSLKKLCLRGIGLSDSEILVNLGGLLSLEVLDLGNNKFSNLPIGIGTLPKLTYLSLGFCQNLVSISELPSNLKVLYAVSCSSLKRLRIQSNLYLAVDYCEKLVEIQGLEYTRSNGKMVIDMGDCIQFATSQNLLKIISESRGGEIIIPGSFIPNWFTHRHNGPSLSFYLPALSDCGIHGLLVLAIFAWSTEFDQYSISLEIGDDHFTAIRNKRNNLESSYGQARLLNDIFSFEDHSWVLYIPFGDLPCEMEQEEELEICFKSGLFGVAVKQCGVHLIMGNQGTTMQGNPSSSFKNPGGSTCARIEPLDKMVVNRGHHDNFEAELGDRWPTDQGFVKRLKMGSDA